MDRVRATLQMLARPDLPPQAWADLSDEALDLTARHEYLPEYAKAVRVGEPINYREAVDEHRPAAALTLVLDASTS